MLRILRNQKGAVAALIAIAATVLLGMAAMVVDVGMLYLNRIQLTNMADAAVLAGVQELPGNPANAVSTALAYARQNGRNDDTVQAIVSGGNTVLTVTASRTVGLLFAQVFGQTNSQIPATAGATVQAISGVSGAAPFGVEKQSFVFGEDYILKSGSGSVSGSGHPGNFGGLALGGNGASVYRDNIQYGYSGKLAIGDWISTEPGNMSGPTNQGVDYRVSLDPAATFETVSRGSPRIVIVPVIDSLAGNGRHDVQIVGFAAFFLEGTGGNGNNNYVTGRFMNMVVAGDIANTTTDYGLYGAKLIQ